MSTPPTPLATLPLQQTPQAPLPPQVQQMLMAAQQGAQQPPQQASVAPMIPPITSTPEYQAVEQAGQGSMGVPGFNAQGQQVPAVGPKEKLKRALSDAIFAIGQGFSNGPAGIYEGATAGGRQYIHQQRQLAAEQAKAQQMEQLGMAQGRLYQGMGRIGEAQAAQSRAEAYGRYVTAIAPKFQADIQNLGARTALANVQAQILPQKLQLEQLATTVGALYKQGMLGVEQNRTNILQQTANIKQALLPYQQAMLGSIAELNKLGQYDKAATVANAYAEMSGILNKVDTFDNQIMHPELIGQAMQQIQGAIAAYDKLVPQMVQQVKSNNAPRPVAPPAAVKPPAGTVLMRGPKGTFHVPAANVSVFTKNGYKVVGKK